MDNNDDNFNFSVTTDSFERIPDDYEPADSRYLNDLHLNRFNLQSERLRILVGLVRSISPGYNTFVKSGYEKMDCLPDSVAKAQDRAMIAAFNQVERICTTDLEPIDVQDFLIEYDVGGSGAEFESNSED
jgi:hypothetical protein